MSKLSKTQPLSKYTQQQKGYRNLIREANLAYMAVLFLERFSLDTGKIDFPIQIATIRMGLSIICFRGSQVDFPYKCVLS